VFFGIIVIFDFIFFELQILRANFEFILKQELSFKAKFLSLLRMQIFFFC